MCGYNRQASKQAGRAHTHTHALVSTVNNTQCPPPTPPCPLAVEAGRQSDLIASNYLLHYSWATLTPEVGIFTQPVRTSVTAAPVGKAGRGPRASVCARDARCCYWLCHHLLPGPTQLHPRCHRDLHAAGMLEVRLLYCEPHCCQDDLWSAWSG